MREKPRVFSGVNAPSALSAMTLARWQMALAVVLGPYDAAGLAVTDLRALEAYAALEAGAWLSAVLHLAEGPVVGEREALCDPLGSLLAAIVLRAVGPLVHGGGGRASPYGRAVAWAYVGACHRRPVRDPMAWTVEALLRCGAGHHELVEVEGLVAEVLTVERVRELVERHERDWEVEALSRALGSDGTRENS